MRRERCRCEERLLHNSMGQVTQDSVSRAAGGALKPEANSTVHLNVAAGDS